jgi:pimeloyl-ACP methyl ester carboxylesterase
MYIETKKILFEQHIDYHPVKFERKVEVFERIMKWTKDPISFVRGYFFDINFEDITREDISEWICWGFFGTDCPEKLENERDKMFLTHMIDKMREMCDRKFPDRISKRNKFVAYSIEPYECGYNMLFIYTITMCIYPALTNLYLYDLGFRQHNIHGIEFWILNQNQAEKPIVLIHGLGGGIFPYCDFIKSLCSLNATIIIPDLSFLSMQMDNNVPDDDIVVLAIKNAIEMVHNNAIIIGHSYGTAIMSWIIQEHPNIVASAVLLDPIAMMLCMHDSVRNILYKERQYNTLGIIQSDPFINWVLRRHFCWLSSILWLEDIENIPYLVVLCMKDDILPAKVIKEYVEDYSKQQNAVPNLLCFEDFIHGEFLSNKKAINEIITAMISSRVSS